jgi:Repeat of unknown function (DUF5648)
MNLRTLGITAGSLLFCAVAHGVESNNPHSTGPVPESHLGATGGFVETVEVKDGTLMQGISLIDEIQVTNHSEQKRLARQGSVYLGLSQDGKRLDWQYDTGWIPDVYGPSGVCDRTFYQGYVPTGNIAITIDNVIVATAAISTGGMGVSSSGTCLMRGGVVASDGYLFSPGNFKIQGTLLRGAQIGSASGNFTVQACAAGTSYAGIPVGWARYNPLTDNFYTTKLSDIALIQQYGWIDRGIPFKLAPRANSYTAHQSEFRRFYKGAPQYEHFYSTNPAETPIVINGGYTNEGVEGYVYKANKAGTTPLYRYARFYPATGDLEHYYTIRTNDSNAAGFGYEGIIGYVCSS